MGIHTSESDGITNTGLGNYFSIGSVAIILIAIGSILIILCAASIIYGLHRRRRQGATVTGGMWYSNYIKLQNSPTKQKVRMKDIYYVNMHANSLLLFSYKSRMNSKILAKTLLIKSSRIKCHNNFAQNSYNRFSYNER